MVTRDQAMTASLFHFGECQRIVGPRGGVRIRIEAWRRNGRTKTWKTRPDDFSVPIKYGLRSFDYLTNYNNDFFHVAEECPA